MTIRMTRVLLAAISVGLAVAASLGHTAEETNPRLHPDGAGWGLRKAKGADTSLPRVLLIGDSIVGGYGGTVSAELKGKAVVDVWTTGLHEASPQLLDLLGKSLASDKYALVHFNIGLHGWPKGRIPEGRYEPLMRNYVATLKKGAPDAVLIWASSTPVTVKGKPAELNPEINPTIVERNAAAARIMQQNGVLVNDLYALSATNLNLAAGDMFHWKEPGKTMQGQSVAAIILANLPQKKP